MATHSSIFAWKILWTEEPGRLVYGVTRVGHDLATKLPRSSGQAPDKQTAISTPGPGCLERDRDLGGDPGLLHGLGHHGYESMNSNKL